MSIEDRVRAVVAPIIEDLQLVLFDLDYGGGRLRVTIDKDDGVDSELLTLATRQISRELDEVDPVPSAYTLEVTTPGIERKLRRPQHYQRSIDYKATIRLYEELDGDRRVTGTIASARDDDFTIRREDGSEVVIEYSAVQKARTVFDWGPTEKPGSRNKQAAAAAKGGSGKGAGKGKKPTNKAGVS